MQHRKGRGGEGRGEKQPISSPSILRREIRPPTKVERAGQRRKVRRGAGLDDWRLESYPVSRFLSRSGGGPKWTAKESGGAFHPHSLRSRSPPPKGFLPSPAALALLLTCLGRPQLPPPSFPFFLSGFSQFGAKKSTSRWGCPSFLLFSRIHNGII